MINAPTSEPPKANWKVKTLGEVCALEKTKHTGNRLPYVGMEDIESDTGTFTGNRQPLSVKSSTFAFTPDHILYGRLRPYLNKVFLPDFEGHCSTEIFPIKTSPELDKRFLFHWISDSRQVKRINETCTGARMPRANLKEVLTFQIPVPPLAEQERIVGILDEAFEGIAAATAQAEKNLHNARELFQSVLQSTFSQKGDDWVEVEVQEVTKLSRGHNPPKSTFVYTPQPGYVRFYQIRDGSSEAHKVYVPETPQLHRVVKTDILMVAYRHVGRAFRGANGAFNVALCKITNAKPDRLDDDFLFYLVPSDLIRGELLKLSERSLIPSMSVKELARLKIPLPPLSTQKAIVEKLDALSEETKRLEAIYERKKAALAELKQSLLQKAFAGEL